MATPEENPARGEHGPRRRRTQDHCIGPRPGAGSLASPESRSLEPPARVLAASSQRAERFPSQSGPLKRSVLSGPRGLGALTAAASPAPPLPPPSVRPHPHPPSPTHPRSVPALLSSSLARRTLRLRQSARVSSARLGAGPGPAAGAGAGSSAPATWRGPRSDGRDGQQGGDGREDRQQHAEEAHPCAGEGERARDQAAVSSRTPAPILTPELDLTLSLALSPPNYCCRGPLGVHGPRPPELWAPSPVRVICPPLPPGHFLSSQYVCG